MCVHHKFSDSTHCSIPITILKIKYTRSYPVWPYVYYSYNYIITIVTTFEESEA